MGKGNNGLTGAYMFRQLTGTTGRYQLTTERLMSQFYRGSMESSTDGTFKAVCLSGIRTDENEGSGPDINDANIVGKFIDIIVRPLTPFGDILPDPRLLTDPNEINNTISIHKTMWTAKSDFGFKDQSAVAFGQVINCYFEDGSIANSDFSGLRFAEPQGAIFDESFLKLSTIEGVVTGITAFEAGLAGLLGPPPKGSVGKNGPDSSKSVDALNPIVKASWLKVKADLEKAGWEPKIVTAFRSLTEQAKKKEQGRSKLTFGNHGAMDENGNRASQALDVIDSRYSYGNSASSIKAIGKPATKDKAFLFWGDLGKFAEKHGFTWGGKYRWKGNKYQFNGKPGPPNEMGWDPGHIEMFGKNGTPSTKDNLKAASTALGRTITSKGTNIL
jgi:hypothetical protein